MLSCDNAQVVPLGLTELAPLLMGTPAAEVWRAVGQLVIAMIIQKYTKAASKYERIVGLVDDNVGSMIKMFICTSR